MKKVITVIMIIFIISSALFVTNATTLNNSKWNLYFENIKITDGSSNPTIEPTIIGSARSEITYSVNLSVPGDYFEFTVDVTNAGNLDAMVSEININQLTNEQEEYLLYEVTYSDGAKIKQNDKLNAGTTERLRIRLEFKKDITVDSLPTENTTLTLSLNACYVQADENAVERDYVTGDDNENNASDVKKDTETKEDSNFATRIFGKYGDNISILLIIICVMSVICIITIYKRF